MIIAIDQSLTCSGVCLMDKRGNFQTYIVKPKKLRGAERLEFIRNALEIYIELKAKYALKGVMEGYSYGSIGRTFELGELGGIIKLLFKKYSVPLEIVPPTVWKKEVVGKGNANKDKVKLVVSDNYNLKFNTQDECDAWCMAEYKRREMLK